MEKRQGWHALVKDRYIKTHARPMKGYKEIKCLFEWRKLPHLCWQICGLKCARICDRYGDSFCDGCPCLKLENGGLNEKDSNQVVKSPVSGV